MTLCSQKTGLSSRQGAGCNGVDTVNDAPNYLTLLQELRTALDSNFGAGTKEITLAVRVQPFDVNGGFVTDMSAYAKVVTRFNLMAYGKLFNSLKSHHHDIIWCSWFLFISDINGGWNADTGPNAPLNYASGQTPFSLTQAVNDWIAAKVPANQLVAGMAFYGRSTTGKSRSLSSKNFPICNFHWHGNLALEDMTVTGSQYQAQSTVVPQGDQIDAYWQDPYCSSDPGGMSGLWQWKYLRSQGVLTAPTTAASPWVRYFDNTTVTPWLFNPTTKMYISYDDTVSLAAKVNLALCKGLAGAMVWDVSNDNGELLAVVNTVKTGTCNGGGSTTTTTSQPTTTTIKASTTASTTTTKTTTVKTTTTTSASATATPTGSASCTASNNGAMTCVAAGTSAQFETCSNNAWVVQSCASGTVCKSSGTSIYCDYP